jgi:hypothetical protein
MYIISHYRAIFMGSITDGQTVLHTHTHTPEYRTFYYVYLILYRIGTPAYIGVWRLSSYRRKLETPRSTIYGQ